MLDLNKKVTRVQLIIVSSWLSFTLGIFYYFLNGKLVDFDQLNKLENINNHQLTNSLLPYINDAPKKFNRTVIHFSTPHCACDQYSKQHIESIDQLSKQHEFNIVKIEFNNHDIIPATPSVAILDEDNELIYFGPYGQGLSCSQTSGYAITVLNNFIQGYKDNVLIKEAKGCYCQV